MVARPDDFRIEPEWYWSRDRAEAEWEAVWCKAWHMGPRVEELAEPGDAMLHTLGRESLIFLRDDAGALRGFYNVCPHRGNRLLLGADGPAHVSAFHCAFHGWRFAQDGAAADIPYRERFDCAALARPGATSLRSFRVAEWAGWVWFTLDAEAPDLFEYLGPIRERLEAYRMERAHIVDYKTVEFGCNWKMVFDAFNESYHFQALHSAVLSWGNEDAPITLLNIHSMMINEYGRPSRLYPDQETLSPPLLALLEGNGIDPAGFEGGARAVRAAVQQSKRAREADSIFPYASLSDGQLSDAYHFLLFPSVHFNLFPEFYVAMRYRPHPSGDPERMYFDFIMCAPLAPGETPPVYEHRVARGGSAPIGEILDWKRWTHPIVEQVLGEDVGLLEHVQAGIRSKGFAGALLSSDERRIAHFHRNIDALVSGRATMRDLIADNVTEPMAEHEQ